VADAGGLMLDEAGYAAECVPDIHDGVDTVRGTLNAWPAAR
jgi:hypothetical protein